MAHDTLLKLADASDEFTAGRPQAEHPQVVCEAINSDTDPIVKVTACDGAVIAVEFLEDVRRTFAGDLDTLSTLITYTAGLACSESRLGPEGGRV